VNGFVTRRTSESRQTVSAFEVASGGFRAPEESKLSKGAIACAPDEGKCPVCHLIVHLVVLSADLAALICRIRVYFGEQIERESRPRDIEIKSDSMRPCRAN
jgi:hypothetical protein